MIKLLFAALAVVPVVVLVVGSWRGRVTVNPCCSPAEQDLRMRAAFEQDGTGPAAIAPDPAGVRATGRAG